MMATKQLQNTSSNMEQLLNQKIESGGINGLPSDSATVVSGYDSVGPDFVLNQSTTATEGSRSVRASKTYLHIEIFFTYVI